MVSPVAIGSCVTFSFKVLDGFRCHTPLNACFTHPSIVSRNFSDTTV